MRNLESKLLDRSARVGILGMGYVGLPLGLAFARKGFSVVGFDVDRTRVKALTQGKSYITDVPSSVVKEMVQERRFRASSNFEGLTKCDVIIICVPTPLRKTREPDNSYVYNACREISTRLHRGQLIVLESTTYPGTTREMARPLLEESGLKVGRDIFLAFSPERVDPSNKTYRIENTPKVIGGSSRKCTKLAEIFYSQVIERVVPVSGTDTAEMVKLLENTFRAVNIGLINEMALMCDRLGVDVWEVVSAAASKPFGYMPFYPGPGLGGHCIPVDPEFLAWKMKTLNFEPRFIALAGSINGRMPAYAVERIAGLLNEMKKPVKGSRILVLGAAYKPSVNDMRESPALDVVKLLVDQGGDIRYHDPHVPSFRLAGRTFRSVPLTSAELKRADIAVILTAHPEVDYDKVVRAARIVFDARNALAGSRRKNVHRL